MASKQKWTEEKLNELVELYPKLTPKKIAEHFDSHLEELNRVYQFALDHKRLHISSETITPENGARAYRYTRYKASVYISGATLADLPDEA